MTERTRVKDYVTRERAEYHATLLVNRVSKRYRHLSRKFRRQNVDCFRLYDWDIPEVRAVVDWYAGHLVIGEYERLQTGLEYLPVLAKALSEGLDVPLGKVHMKRRRTSAKHGVRYQKLSARGERFIVHERSLRFWVNLDDHLDTGLYSDHRETRMLVRELAAKKTFLNLFAYTGTFTCAAALGGAGRTVSVDRSATYLKWAEDNLKLNGFSGGQHKFVQSDALQYLDKVALSGLRFSFCFVDPPSFFKEKTRGKEFDINRDHPQLLDRVLKVMDPGGTVIFSTNHQRFSPCWEGLGGRDLKELTPGTIPEDYRNRQVHRCWMMKIPL